MAKYDPLTLYLIAQKGQLIVLTFGEIEKIIGATLPKSAHDFREWWANEDPGGAHVQSKAWLSGGYKVDSVDLTRERVNFERSQK